MAACAASIQAQGHPAYSCGFEATSVAATRRMVEEVTQHFGRVDRLVNCRLSAILFLVTPASGFITGQTLYLDGGITATQ